MNKYLSIVFLYNRASQSKILLIIGAIPLCFLAIFLVRVGNPYEASPNMLMERAFGGIWTILVFVIVNLMGIFIVSNSLNRKKELKATNATTGYTMRRLCITPISSFVTIFVYYLALILIFWAVAIASLFIIGKVGMIMAGATDIDMKLALGLLRTEIGHALIPMRDPLILAFNGISILALASQCARSCYLRWHNGTPAATVLLVIVLMFLLWTNILTRFYVLMIFIIVAMLAVFAFGDVVFREKRPKGDPFMVNKYEGILDFDNMDFDDDVYAMEVNSAAEAYGLDSEDESALERYGRVTASKNNQKLRGLRCRYMPLGINLEKVNSFFGICIFIGVAEHMIFFGKYMMQIWAIKSSLKGVTINSDAMMPYFCDLQEHTYYGYIVAILLAFGLQAYWNYEYYNKKTKSVYVMKRLPNRKEYPRTIWVAPAMQAAFIAVIMVLNAIIDLLVYNFATPDIALYPDYLSHILPF